MRLTGRLIILLVLAALSLFPAVSRADNGINIPASHPLLWWTSARLAQARAYYAAHPLPIPESDDPYGCAFYYLMTGNTTYAHQAIQWAVDLTADTTTSDGADYARWDGEDVFLVYDWCYDQMQPADKQTLFNRWNAYIAAFNQYSWGGPDMPSNNYYHGFMRNTIEWGMAAYHEPGNQSQAQAFIDEGLITRWQNSSLPYFSNDGRGGVPPEGTQYGAYTLY